MAAERRQIEREGGGRKRRGSRVATGLGVDAAGAPVIDPTENVRELFEAGSTRQDDLRLAERRLQEEKIRCVEQQMRALQHEVQLRAEHQRDLDALESKRLDAVRSVDQLASKTEADRQAAAVTTLATQAATTAETLRSAVNTSATNLATQSDRNQTAMIERIAALEKSSYTGQGKQAVVDPQMERLSSLVENLVRSRANDTGQRQGLSDGWKLLIAVVGLLAGLNALGLFSRAPVAPPQVIYTPAPAGTQLPSTPPSSVPR